MEVLNRMLLKMEEERLIKGFEVGNVGGCLSHIFYLLRTLILCDASTKEVLYI